MRLICRFFGLLLAGLFIAGMNSIIVNAEGTPEPGPHPSNFKLVNDGSAVSEYTGSLNWKYNLLTVPGRGGLDFPINLTYGGNGIGCEQEASWVGLGFGLNLGSIDRSVVYIPDDMFLSHYHGEAFHQHDGFLFEDNYDNLLDSVFSDGPDMWSVSLNDLGFPMSIVADSTNIFYESGKAYGPAGKSYRAMHDYGYYNKWLSTWQHSWGLIVLIGDEPYEPWTGEDHLGDRARNAHVSPAMGDTVDGKVYDFTGEIILAFNDTLGGFANNSGSCEVYVYKLDAGSSSWGTHGPFTVSASSQSGCSTGVTVETGDRFGIFARNRKFVPANWSPVRIDYDVEFTDWGGYYFHPEGYNNPNAIWKEGYTPRISKFRITGDEGTQYIFGQSDYIKATSRKFNGAWLDYQDTLHYVEDSVSLCYDYSYKLTEILSHDYVDADNDGQPSDGDCGNWVRIVYDSSPIHINYANKSLKGFDAIFHRIGNFDRIWLEPVWQHHFVHYPNYIETPTHKLDFILSTRLDNLGYYGPTAPDSLRPKKLDSLVLYYKSPSGLIHNQKITFTYADSSKPSTFSYTDYAVPWEDDEILAYHKEPFDAYDADSAGGYWVGKLTLLSIGISDANGESLPPMKFTYTTNPHYEEAMDFGERNEKVDFYHFPSLGPSSYYAGGYEEDWGYFRPALSEKPGWKQKAWALVSITYPQGANESVEWESNKYLWWSKPTGLNHENNLQYRQYAVDEDDGVERGGVRVKFRRVDGGCGTDSSYGFEYGEGIATKPQSTALKAFYCGLLGNSQEIGYRSASVFLRGEPDNQKTTSKFTNGSAGSNFASYNEGATPSPVVDTLVESFPDRLIDGAYHLHGVQRGLPYLQIVTNTNGDTTKVVENGYDFKIKEAYRYSHSYGNWGKPYVSNATSLWVKKTAEKTRLFDENGANPVWYYTWYEYDTLNGLVTLQVDSLGNGIKRRVVTEYLRDDNNLESAMEERNLLSLVRREAVERDLGGTIDTVSQSLYEYANFGNDRIFLERRLDYSAIGGDVRVDTTTYNAYDRYGNLRMKTSPGGTKTSYLWGYSGGYNVLTAPNADTNEVSYNGFEDSLSFSGWEYSGNATLTSSYSYSGNYSAALDWPTTAPWRGILFKEITCNLLSPVGQYVFSAWLHTETPWTKISVYYNDSLLASDTAQLGDWDRLEVIFQIPDTLGSLRLKIWGMPFQMTGTVYVDDLRFHPLDCPMEAYVYDRTSGQLEAIFDANNVAAERYYYDGFGRLIEIRDPNDKILATYEYFYSRSQGPDEGFNPNFPNYVKETNYRTAGVASVTVTFYDGLGRELQTVTQIDNTLRLVTATYYNPAGQVAGKTKPIEYVTEPSPITYITDLVPSDWSPGDSLISGPLAGYYDDDGPGPDCNGFPFTQFDYTTDPLRRISELGHPDVAWNIGSDHTTRTDYLSNGEADVSGWGANTLAKVKTTDESGLQSYQYLDQLGRVVQTQVDSADTAFKTCFVLDALGNVREAIAPDGKSTHYQYDALGRLTYRNSPDMGGVRYVYNRDGNLRFVADSAQVAEDSFIFYKYDALGRIIQEGLVADLDYFVQDSADNRHFPTSGMTVHFNYSYDSVGTEYSRGRLSRSFSTTGNFSHSYEYDQQGRVAGEQVKVDNISNHLDYTYDWQGNMLSRSVNDTVEASYIYDSSYRLVGVGNSTYLYDSLTYWPTGQIRTEFFRENGSTVSQRVDYSYNPRNWLLAINDPDAVTDTMSSVGDHFGLQFGYGASWNGNVDSLINKTTGQDLYQEVFTYDRIGRLNRWHDASDGGSTANDHVYTYDRVGNFIQHRLPNTANPDIFTYFPGTNRIDTLHRDSGSKTHAWDANGNLLSDGEFSYKYTYRNQLYRVKVPKILWNDYVFSYYDADKQRVKKKHWYHEYCECDTILPPPDRYLDGHPHLLMSTGGGGGCICNRFDTTIYIHSFDGLVMREYVNSELDVKYLYAGSQRIGQRSKIGANWRLFYILADHLGSTRCMLDSSGTVFSRYDYYPFGPTKSAYAAYASNRRYTGKELDTEENINLHYFGARFLHNTNLRFTSVDPLADKYPSWSPYVYALDNPVRLNDPNGEHILDMVAGVVDAIGSDMFLGIYEGTPSAKYEGDRSDFLAGQVLGHVSSMIGGAAISAVSAQAAAGYTLAGPNTGGISLIGAAVCVTSAFYHAGVAIQAAENLGITLNSINENSANSGGDKPPTIRNKHLAGKTHPKTGIPFDNEGFPDFSEVATKTVKIEQTGIRQTDFRLANEAAGFDKIPKGYTWHHHQDGKTMQLVPEKTHQLTGHTGGVGLYGGK